MLAATVTFRLPSRTFLRRLALGIQHGLSFNDPFKQHNSRSRICCFRQLYGLLRMFSMLNTIADGTRWKERCSIRLAEEPLTPRLPNDHWNSAECSQSNQQTLRPPAPLASNPSARREKETCVTV